jgi:hypothetical protein
MRNPAPSFLGEFFGCGYGTDIQRANLRGMPGFYTVPGSWTLEQDGSQVFTTSPTDGRRYACYLNWDGRLLFQSLLPPV